MRPRRADDAEDVGRGEQHLEVDVGAAFDVVAEKADIMRQDADLDLVDQLRLGQGGGRRQQHKGGGEADDGARNR